MDFKTQDIVIILPINEVGRIIKIRDDTRGVPIFDVERENGQIYLCRKFEIKLYDNDPQPLPHPHLL